MGKSKGPVLTISSEKRFGKLGRGKVPMGKRQMGYTSKEQNRIQPC